MNCCARLVPDIAEFMSSVTAEEGLGGRLPFVGSGGGTAESTLVASSGEDRCTLILELVTLLGILIGEGVGFLIHWNALCAASVRSARRRSNILTSSPPSSEPLRA